MTNRRDFLKCMCQSAIVAMASSIYPGTLFADALTDKRFVVVILRGGLDGLGALAPYGDPNYTNIRGNLALSTDGLLKVDPLFGLHPGLESFANLYKQGEMIAIPASASPYRERSHFDAQNVLELGGIRPFDLKSGWLNRLVGEVNANSEIALAFSQGVPQMLRGKYDVNSWAPSTYESTGNDYFSLVRQIYAQDQKFLNNFDKALGLQEMGMDVLDGQNEKQLSRQTRTPQGFPKTAEMAGKWLARIDGPRIATLELGGWDTHVQQGTEGGRLANNLSLFARGIDELKKNLGPAWSKTVVVAVTEFGRTVRPNGSNGTDHGTAGTAFLFGGALKGGRIIHDWPGLADSQLYENRDVKPTIDVRSVMKGILKDHYNIPVATLDTTIYPDSSSAKPLEGLLRV